MHLSGLDVQHVDLAFADSKDHALGRVLSPQRHNSGMMPCRLWYKLQLGYRELSRNNVLQGYFQTRTCLSFPQDYVRLSTRAESIYKVRTLDT